MKSNLLDMGIHFLKASSSKIRKDYNASASRTLHLAGISGIWNILLGLGKVISGLLSFSGFFTFTEIALNIRGVLVNRKKGTLLVHALKTINLAASLISLVLTQSAILSIAQGGYHNPSSNALLGLLAGGGAALLGVFMRWRIRQIEVKNNRKEEEKTSDPDFGSR